MSVDPMANDTNKIKLSSLNEVSSRPTRVRYGMVLLATLVAVLLYLDRICISTAAASVSLDLGISKLELDQVLSAFFLTYALGQLPAGWLGDRFGARWMLGGYIVLWSLSTGLIGIAGSLQMVLILRLATGLFEAGAYPVAASLVRRWMPLERRGIASSVVAVGGRLGGAIAPILTMQLMLFWTLDGDYLSQPENVVPSPTSWRPAMVLYGVLGVVIAIVFMWYFRDDPDSHPNVNEAEAKLIRGSSPRDSSNGTNNLEPNFPPLLAMVCSLPLWMNCFVQFTSNFGWAFLVTKMPQYLNEVFETSAQDQSWMQSLPLAAGIPGLLLGGLFTDYLVRRLGLRWGRAVAMSLSRMAVATAFAATLFSDSAFIVIVCFVCMSFATDLGTPACWAFCQDIGGKNVGAVLGWANMWGNLGAFLSPLAFGMILRSFATSHSESTVAIDPAVGWHWVFGLCCCINLIAAVAAYFINTRHAAIAPPK